MTQKNILITVAVAALLLIIYFAVVHQNTAPKHYDSDPQATPTGDATATPAPETSGAPESTFEAGKEIHFAKSLVITRKGIGIDGGPLLDIPCDSDDAQSPTFFGFFSMVDGTRVDLSCVNGDDGTIDLRYPSKDGETQTYIVASASTDEEGQSWDLRSWLSKDAQTNAVSIQSVTLRSSVNSEEEDQAGASCDMNEKQTLWNEQERDFTDSMPTGEVFDMSKFAQPINVAVGCLNPDGSFKNLK